MQFDERMDAAWSQGLRTLAPSFEAGDHERVMQKVDRRRRHRRMSIGAAASILVLAGAISIMDRTVDRARVHTLNPPDQQGDTKRTTSEPTEPAPHQAPDAPQVATPTPAEPVFGPDGPDAVAPVAPVVTGAGAAPGIVPAPPNPEVPPPTTPTTAPANVVRDLELVLTPTELIAYVDGTRTNTLVSGTYDITYRQDGVDRPMAIVHAYPQPEVMAWKITRSRTKREIMCAGVWKIDVRVSAKNAVDPITVTVGGRAAGCNG